MPRDSTPVVIGVDASTTAVKAIAWDVKGGVVASSSHPVELSNPAPRAYEQDAEQWWTACCRALAEVATAIPSRTVQALAISNQRETVVVTDLDGRPRRPALVWMDERCAPLLPDIGRQVGPERLHRLSGKPLCATPSAYKLAWLRAHEPGAFDGPCRVMDVHGFLVQRLTGQPVTSTAAADPTGMIDMAAGAWSPELLAIAGLDETHVPSLVPPGHVIGGILPDVAVHTGLPAGTAVVAGAGDGQAAGLGAHVTDLETAYLNLGTALVSGTCGPDYRTDRAFRTLYGAIPGTYFYETDLKGGTFTLNWLAQLLGHGADPTRQLAALESQACELPPGAEGLLVVPYWCGVMNPYWDDDASGLMVGLRGHHGPAHIYRATIEGLVLEQRVQTAAAERALGTQIRELVVVGGGARSDLWCQIVADVMGRPVIRAGTPEASALGAGILAAVGAGLYTGFQPAAEAMTRRGARFEPGEAAPRYDRLFEVYRGLYPATRDAMASLAQID